MDKKEIKRRIAHEVIIILGVLLVITFITKMWPVILLMILVIFAYALRLLFLSVKTVEVIVPAPPTSEIPSPETEQSILHKAFGLLQRRITGALAVKYPNARWIWGTQNAMTCFEVGDPLVIFLKNAGGYQKAFVRTRNLLFLGIEFETVATQQPYTPQPEIECVASSAPADIGGDDRVSGTSTDYGLIAYEWVSAHLVSINRRFNEEIAKNREELLIPSDELPHPDSWFDICTELKRNGFAESVIREDGIEVNLAL